MVVTFLQTDSLPVPCHLHRSIHLFHLQVFGCCLTVGRDDALDAESTKVGHVAKVATIGHHGLAILTLLVDTAICPFPDEASQHAWVAVNLIPVFLEIA